MIVREISREVSDIIPKKKKERKMLSGQEKKRRKKILMLFGSLGKKWDDLKYIYIYTRQ